MVSITNRDDGAASADCAHVGFLHDDNWEPVDGSWVFRRKDDSAAERWPPDDVWFGTIDPDGEPVSPVTFSNVSDTT